MLKLFCVLFAFVGIGGSVKAECCNSICESFDDAVKIATYTNSVYCEYGVDDSEFEKIMDALKNVTRGSRDMPAYGVSLDGEVRVALKSGVWVELTMNGEKTFGEMPFEKLLIQVEPEAMGFNLVRYHNGEYEGRCFYLDLDVSMRELYDTISSISEN